MRKLRKGAFNKSQEDFDACSSLTELLIKKRASVNAVSLTQTSPLTTVLYYWNKENPGKSEEIFRLLVDHGVNEGSLSEDQYYRDKFHEFCNQNNAWPSSCRIC